MPLLYGWLGGTVIYIYIIFIFLLMAMAIWIALRVKTNREKIIQENAPAVAGRDFIRGSVEDDGRFDEPTEDDLEQMEKILEEALD
ncbi:MAG: hypothetical protein CMB56_007090 [Methanobacteriota archaeon]|nr:MAG: hypothetical protein CMB56_007090 [Euryarchaeota archaeon]